MKAASYSRVSTDDQVEGTSLDEQQRRCREFVKAQGWELAGEFTDEGVSGAKASRPQLDKLMRAAEAHEFEAVVVTRLDRFGRSNRHLEAALGDLDDWGVRFVSLSDSIDSGTASGRLQRSMLGAFAEFERASIRERGIGGMRAAAKRGRFLGGDPPFGLRAEPGDDGKPKLVIDEGEAEVVRKAAELVIEGASTWECAAELNTLGFRPRKAERFDHLITRRLLLASHLGGTWSWGKQSKRYKAAGGPVAIAVPPVLDPDTLAAVRAALGATSTRRGPEHTYPLSGRLVGLCGSPFQGFFRKDRGPKGPDGRPLGQRNYRCRDSRPEMRQERCREDEWVRADRIEAAVWSEVVELLADPDRLLSMAADWLGLEGAAAKSQAGQLELVDKEVAKLEKALGRATRDALRADLDDAALRLATQDLNADLGALRKRRATLASWAERANAATERAHDLERLADYAADRLANADLALQRSVIDLLDIRVAILAYNGRGKLPQLKIEGFVDPRLLTEGEAAGSTPFRLTA